MVKLCLFGIIAALIGIKFKSVKAEYGIYISVAACIIIMSYSLLNLESIMNTIYEIKKLISLDNKYILLLFKIIGITYVAEFSSALCKDSGYGAIGGQIEMAGKLSVLVISLPVFASLLDTIDSML